MSEIRSQPLQYDATDKAAIDHVEKLGLDGEAAAVTYTGQGLLKSRFDEMSIPRTIWVFRRSVLVVLAVYTGYMCEGFEVSHSHVLS
jgi:SP family general alpha glucoside:H+ symporter-like MFS transporter